MKLYFKYLTISIKSKMQHRASFVMTALGQFLTSFTGFLGVYYMFSRFHSVNGFEFSEVLLCFSVVLMAFSLSECFFRGFDTFPNLVRSGVFDRILVRPRGIFFQVLASNMEFSRVGRLAQAVLMFAYALAASGIVWTADKVFTLVFMIVGGVAVGAGLYILYAGISFFTIDSLEIMNIFTHGTSEFGKYPLSIYGDGVLKFFTYVIPVALYQYYPFLYISGRSANVLYALLPLVSVVFVAPCCLFFRYALKRYTSTGS